MSRDAGMIRGPTGKTVRGVTGKKNRIVEASLGTSPRKGTSLGHFRYAPSQGLYLIQSYK